MLQLHVPNLASLPQAAAQLIEYTKPARVFTFQGEMGAGKTTFIKTICEYLGCREITSSPTFSIVNEYETQTGQTIYHFDFYRITNEQEVYDMGYEEYLYSGHFCFIEWPEKISNLLPHNAVNVKLEVTNNTRMITIYS